MSLLSVVILNYNGAKYLQKFLPKVVEYSKEYEVIVADNASTDNSISLTKELFPSVKTIQLTGNFGFCGGYNMALRQIRSKYFLLLNSDIEVTANWIGPMIAMMEENPEVAAVQPKIRSYTDKHSFEYAGAAGGYIDKYGYPFCRGRLFDTLETDQGQYNDPHEIFWATGACMLIRSELFHSHGGFDEHFFAHMEEIDLCWRLKNAGYRIMYCPGSVVFHVGGGTLPKDNPRKVYYNFRNSLFLLTKNLPSEQLAYKLIIRLILDFPAAVSYLLKGSLSCCWSIFQAHMAFYRHLPKYLKQRKGVHGKPELMHGYYTKSLLIKYYLQGARKFSDLASQ